MKIAFLSDTHFGNMACPPGEGSGPFLEDDHVAFAKRAHDAEPDALVVAGDVAETIIDPRMLTDFFEIYKNPHGASIFVPGNHDMWCVNVDMRPEEKYDWYFSKAERMGWVGLRDEPWSKDGVFVAGNMGWFDFSSAPVELGMTPEKYELERRWSDYHNMGFPSFMAYPGKTPMLDFNKKRMEELEKCLSKVPKDRKKLVVVTHFVGFEALLGPKRDYYTAFFGNLPMGRRILKSKPDLYYCGHTHSRVEAMIKGVKCINNGSGYGVGSKKMDIIEL